MWVYVIIIFILIGIITYLIDSLYNFFIFLQIFFVDTFWGLATIICGLISALMFYASSRTYVDSKINESFLPHPRNFSKAIGSTGYFSKETENRLRSRNIKSSPKGDNSMTKQDSQIVHDVDSFNKNREIDLAKVTMDAMLKKMAYVMTKPGPVFFKGWGNKRLQLDVDRVYIVKGYIDAVRSSLDSYTNLRADALISFDKIEKLAQIQKNELLHKLKKSELDIGFLEEEYEHKVKEMNLNLELFEVQLLERVAQIQNLEAQTSEVLKTIDIRIKETDAEIERRRKESDAIIELNKAKADAEIYVMKLQAQDTSKLSKQRARILTKIINEMQLDNITPTEVYLLVKLMEADNATGDYTDFDKKTKIITEEIEKMKQQNNILRSEAQFVQFNNNRKMGKV